MLLKRNLLETVTLACSCATFLCILLNYVTNISPITGMWFLIYIVLLIIVSLVLSIKLIQWLLHLNKPVKYDLEGLVKEYPLLSFLRSVLPEVKVKEKRELKDYDTNELSVISTVLERKLVSSWYVPYISEEIGFPFACKQLLDQMINKTFQICNKIETKDVYVDMCAILITHLKEYKKALKRYEKAPSSTVESLYKKSHPIFDPVRKLSSADHCVNILRIILKELVPWELWDTPHSELIIRILAKKLDNFIDSTLSDPAWLNDKLFMILEKKQDKEEPVKEPKTNLDINEGMKEKVEPGTKEVEATMKEPVTPPVTSPDPTPAPEVKPAPVSQKVVDDEAQEMLEEVNNFLEEDITGSEPVEIKPSAVLRQRRGRQGRNEVKIYDRIIEGSVKTWETDMDLQCISVGQDLLASLDEMTLSRLWGQEDAEHSPNLRNRSPQPLWFGEEDSIDIDHPEPESKEVKKESSPKPTEALLKDIQSTVHQAKTKIGDLQVPLDIDVPCKHSSDEAAGMMEGLLDIGIAGIRKGLRFTGLSDDSQDKSPHHKDKNDKTSPPDSARSHSKTSAEPKDSSHVQQKEENGNSVHPLVKQQRVISQDSVPHPQGIPIRADPPPPLPDSPEPEYEEVADLSTSIARLRSLLETANVNRTADDIWWEGAEETRGRTHHGQNYTFSRPIDTATLADEYDMTGEPNSSPRQASNNMQRLDKLFHRTVTGVFNSIKTAVSAEEELLLQPTADWTFIVANSVDNSVSSSVARLLGARRGAWQVDAALDSLHQLNPPPLQLHLHPGPEDLEEWMASECKAWSGASELASACGIPRAHVSCRLAALLAADLGETLISSWLDELTCWLREQVFVAFRQMAEQDQPPPCKELREFNIEETCRMLIEKIPHVYMFGEEAVTEAVRLVVASFSHEQLNREVAYRALDLLAAHYRRAAALRSSFTN